MLEQSLFQWLRLAAHQPLGMTQAISVVPRPESVPELRKRAWCCAQLQRAPMFPLELVHHIRSHSIFYTAKIRGLARLTCRWRRDADCERTGRRKLQNPRKVRVKVYPDAILIHMNVEKLTSLELSKMINRTKPTQHDSGVNSERVPLNSCACEWPVRLRGSFERLSYSEP